MALAAEPLIQAEAEKRMKAGKADPMQKSAQGTSRDELAKIADVSHDTIHKVEVIEAKGNDYLKEQVKNGDISINQAYGLATGAEAEIRPEYAGRLKVSGKPPPASVPLWCRRTRSGGGLTGNPFKNQAMGIPSGDCFRISCGADREDDDQGGGMASGVLA